MQKSKNLLLTLSTTEREAVQSFIKRRLKTLSPDSATDLQALSQMSKQLVRRLQLDKSQYARSPSRTGKLMAKLHDMALVDAQVLIKELDQTVYTLQNQAQQKTANANAKIANDDPNAETSNGNLKVEEMIVKCEEDETSHATEVIKDRLENMRLPDLKLFRDACQDILTWWESEKGQIDSLHMDQIGNVNSTTGRVAIRQRRDEMLKTVFNPFKMFYRQLNTNFQRKSKMMSNQARMRAAQQRREQQAG